MRDASTVCALALALAVGTTAHAAEIYKCRDKEGRALYTSEKRDTVGKKCQLVAREVNVVPAAAVPKAPARAPAGQPGGAREDASTRAAARERQRVILEKELVAEQEMLGKARTALAQQEAQRSGDERNYARVLDRLKPYQDDVEVHERNIQALKRELDNLYR